MSQHDHWLTHIISAAARESGAAAEIAASRKKEKYADLDGRYIFEPIAIDTLGVLNTLASQLQYSLCLPTEGWPGWVDLGDWLYTEIDIPAPGVESQTRSPIPVHPFQARRRLTSLIKTNALTNKPNRQPLKVNQ